MVVSCLFLGANEREVAAQSGPSPTRKPVAPAPIKVFILAGQSNMQGQAVIEMDDPRDYNGGKGNLVWSMEHSASRELMRHLRGADGRWTERDDVRVRYQTEHELKTGNLTVGFTGYPGRHHIGLELQLGHVLGDYFDEPVLLVKTCWGGKSLYRDFRPPSAGGEVGPYYRQMIAEVREALQKIPDEFPDWRDRQPQISGLVWMQGWNDMVDDAATAEYASNLEHLVRDVRAEFDLPELPVAIGELGNGGDPPFGESGPSRISEFRQQQQLGASRIERATFVETHAFSRPAELSPNVTHGHHWFGNAESYFLIGQALGEALVEMHRSAK